MQIFLKNASDVPSHIVEIQLRDNAKPGYLKARTVPLALHEKVDQEVNNLEASGIIT